MKHLKISLLLLLLFLFSLSLPAKKRHSAQKVLYGYGVASSFMDSLMYVTQVQVLEGASEDENGFVTERGLFSEQLRHYVEDVLGKRPYVSVVFVSDKMKDLTKSREKLEKKYRNSSLQRIDLSPTEFTFTSILRHPGSQAATEAPETESQPASSPAAEPDSAQNN